MVTIKKPSECDYTKPVNITISIYEALEVYRMVDMMYIKEDILQELLERECPEGLFTNEEVEKMAAAVVRARDNDDNYMDAYWRDVRFGIEHIAKQSGKTLPD